MDFRQILLQTLGLDLIPIAIAAACLIPFFARLFAPKLSREILSDLRIPRILHYVVLTILGASIFRHVNQADLTGWITHLILPTMLFAICLVYAAVFAIVSNNIADLGADQISNPSRPLVRGTVERAAYLRAAILCLAISLLLAAALSIELLAGLFAISAIYFAYSCKPFRLKRIPVLAKAMIGLNSLIAALCGFELAGGSWKELPLQWGLFVFLPLSLSANFVDLKDTEGDKATGVATLPVLLGEKKARWLIAAFTLLSYLMAGFLIGIAWIWPLVGLNAIVHIWLLFRKPYRELPIFLVYLAGITGLTLILTFHEFLNTL